MASKKDITGVLQALGFTEYEARAYLSLLQASSLNGYETAKASGIPRANIYAVLERLVARRAARRLETSDGRRYAATPPKLLLERLDKNHRHSLDAAREALESLKKAPAEAPVFNLRNRTELLEHARAALGSARESLLVAIQSTEAAELAPVLAAARDRGVTISTLCMEACAAECGGCVGDIHRSGLAPADGARWFMLVADDRRMIAAEMRGGTTQAIATEQRLIVELAASYIRQSRAFATVAGALGERFDGLLSMEARKVLDDLHPEGGFLAYLTRVVGEKAD
ncbi:MAG: TrmB family transcriptional regulator [Gammaproteobacteria bacterium]